MDEVAVAAGAISEEVEKIAALIHGAGTVTLDAARAALASCSHRSRYSPAIPVM